MVGQSIDLISRITKIKQTMRQASKLTKENNTKRGRFFLNLITTPVIINAAPTPALIATMAYIDKVVYIGLDKVLDDKGNMNKANRRPKCPKKMYGYGRKCVLLCTDPIGIAIKLYNRELCLLVILLLEFLLAYDCIGLRLYLHQKVNIMDLRHCNHTTHLFD